MYYITWYDYPKQGTIREFQRYCYGLEDNAITMAKELHEANPSDRFIVEDCSGTVIAEYLATT